VAFRARRVMLQCSRARVSSGEASIAGNDERSEEARIAALVGTDLHRLGPKGPEHVPLVNGLDKALMGRARRSRLPEHSPRFPTPFPVFRLHFGVPAVTTEVGAANLVVKKSNAGRAFGGDCRVAIFRFSRHCHLTTANSTVTRFGSAPAAR
jgi:hypothetical protein